MFAEKEKFQNNEALFLYSNKDIKPDLSLSAMHGDEGNPHAHMQVSRRYVDKDGSFSWAKYGSVASVKDE